MLAKHCVFNRLRVWLLVAIVPVVVACAPIKVTTTMQMPANSTATTQLKRIAVLPFDHRYNVADITPEIEALLAGVTVNERPYFTVVERNRITDLLREIKLGERGVIDTSDTNKVSKLGKMVGANGIYAGAITRSDIDDRHYTESRFRCNQYEKKENRETSKCVSSSTYTVNCIERTANFAFAPKLIDVETGTIKYAQELTGTSANTACRDSAQGIADAKQLLHEARLVALNKFRLDVAPYTTTLSVALLESTDGFKSAEARDKFTSGLNFAKANRMDRACELWQEVALGGDRSVSLIYDQGVCLEIRGDLGGALALYTKADHLLSEPDNVISSALTRVNLAMKNQDKLKKQLGN